jgi:hypothetical protein
MGKVAEFQVHIVEQVADETPRDFGRNSPRVTVIHGSWLAGVGRSLRLSRLGRSGAFKVKMADHLQFAFVKNLEILLVKISDGPTPAVAHYNPHHN